jgi:DNA-binding MarR family transcriptional regulator
MSREPSTPREELAERLHSAAIHLLRRLRKEDEQGGLNAPRLSALSVIVFGGPVTLRDLAAAEQVRPPTMTRIVKALEEKGLVAKRQNAEDGRSTFIVATTRGKKVLLKGRDRRIRLLVGQIDPLTNHERAILAEAAGILGKMLARI